jgi:hypothetical protein
LGLMSEQHQHSPPPGRQIGQGDKYDLVKLFLRSRLGVSVEDWIRDNRAQAGGSYYALADELNAMFRKKYGADAPRVTFESIRRWDPDGEFQRKARERQAPPAADPPAAPPVRFRPPEMVEEAE